MLFLSQLITEKLPIEIEVKEKKAWDERIFYLQLIGVEGAIKKISWPFKGFFCGVNLAKAR